MKIVVPPTAERWLFDVFNRLEQALNGVWDRPFRLKTFTVSTLPDPTKWRGGLIIVTDETDGEVLAWSDGTDWKRATDGAVVS